MWVKVENAFGAGSLVERGPAEDPTRWTSRKLREKDVLAFFRWTREQLQTARESCGFPVPRVLTTYGSEGARSVPEWEYEWVAAWRDRSLSLKLK